MRLNKSDGKRIAAYAAILGVIYLTIGLIEFVNAFWSWFIAMGGEASLFGFPGLPKGDLFGGLAAIVVGAVYLGAAPLWRGRRELLGFPIIGGFLSAALGGVYLLIVLADGLEALLAYLAGEGWTWEWLLAGTAETGLLRPEIWLFILSLPLTYYAWRAARRR